MQDLSLRRFEQEWEARCIKGQRLALAISEEGLRGLLLDGLMQRTLSGQSPWKRLFLVGSDKKQLQALESSLRIPKSLASCYLPELTSWGVERYANQSIAYRQRLKSLYCFSTVEAGLVAFVTSRALGQFLPAKDEYKPSIFRLRVEQELDLESLESKLIEYGYQLVEQVVDSGDYTKRGGIIDFFPPHEELAVRVEFFGDEISSLRFFDVNSQRSKEKVSSVDVIPMYQQPLFKVDKKKNFQLLYDSLLDQELDKYDRQGVLDSFEKGYRLPNHEMFEPVFRHSPQAKVIDFIDPQDPDNLS